MRHRIEHTTGWAEMCVCCLKYGADSDKSRRFGRWRQTTSKMIIISLSVWTTCWPLTQTVAATQVVRSHQSRWHAKKWNYRVKNCFTIKFQQISTSIIRTLRAACTLERHIQFFAIKINTFNFTVTRICVAHEMSICACVWARARENGFCRSPISFCFIFLSFGVHKHFFVIIEKYVSIEIIVWPQ